MKNLKLFLLENKQTCKNQLFRFISIDEYEPYDSKDNTPEEFNKLIDSFLKDAKNLKFETSDREYWDDYGVKTSDLDFSENKDIEDKCIELYKDCDWVGMDLFSIKIENNVLYISSQTGSHYNGEYFDLKVTKV